MSFSTSSGFAEALVTVTKRDSSGVQSPLLLLLLLLSKSQGSRKPERERERASVEQKFGSSDYLSITYPIAWRQRRPLLAHCWSRTRAANSRCHHPGWRPPSRPVPGHSAGHSLWLEDRRRRQRPLRRWRNRYR